MKTKSFTLIELIVIVAIVGILVGFIIIALGGARESANDAKRKADINQLSKSIMIYKTNNPDATLPIADECNIGGIIDPCSNDVLNVLGESANLRDPDNAKHYTYSSSDGSNYVLKGELSNTDNYVFDSSTGSYGEVSSAIDGTCGTAVRTFAYDETSYGSYTQCATGTSSNTNFPAQGSSETWTCSGQNGGNPSSDCVAARSAPIDGTCGTAVRTFAYDETSYGSYTQCATGTPSNTNFPAEGSSETWTCSGQNGGNASSDCTASRNSASIDGTCGTAVRTFAYDETSYGSYTQCATGTSSNTNFPAQGSSETWTCSGQNGGNPSSDCVAARNGTPVNGACGTANKTFYATVTSYGTTTFCSTGSLSATPSFPAVGGSSSWSCNGSSGGTTAPCSASRSTSACVSGGGLTCSETTYSTYAVNKYTGTGTTNWTAPSGVTSVTYLVIGGGGSGGNYNAGGGGAGGMRTSTLTVVSGQPYTVKVGAGGTAVTGQTVGNNGSESQFSTITAAGGGGGGYTNNAVSGQGKSGGSGGGGGGCSTGMANMSQVPGNPTSGQGSIGGAGYTGTSKAGGGGGAGAAGGAATYSYGGNGGNGLQSSITGTSLYYAGGGGAAGSYQVDTSGGSGGGGKGSTISTDYVYSNGYPGTDGFGGGGGGGAHQSYSSGKGGSGVVIIRFTIP